MYACVFDGFMGMWLWRAEDNSVEFILSFHCGSWRFNKGHQALSPAELSALGVRVTMFLKMTQGDTHCRKNMYLCVYTG